MPSSWFKMGQFAVFNSGKMTGKYHFSFSWLGTEHCIGSQRSIWSWWAVFQLVLSDSIEETIKLPPYEYSSFHEHFNTCFRGNRPEFRVCWTGVGLLHVTAVIPSCRHEVWPFPEAALGLCLSSHCRLICCVQSRQLILFCTFPNHTPLGFITSSVWPSAQPQGILLHFSFVCSPFSVWAEGLDRLGAVWPGASVRWGKLQNGTREEIRNMRSPLCMHEGTQRD